MLSINKTRNIFNIVSVILFLAGLALVRDFSFGMIILLTILFTMLFGNAIFVMKDRRAGIPLKMIMLSSVPPLLMIVAAIALVINSFYYENNQNVLMVIAIAVLIGNFAIRSMKRKAGIN